MASRGYKVVSVPNERQFLSGAPGKTSGMIFEFSGPAGVGKTTLYRSVMAARRAHWFPIGAMEGMVTSSIEEPEELQPVLSDLIVRMVAHEQARSPMARTVAGAAGLASRATKRYIMVRRRYTLGVMMDDGILSAFRHQLPSLSQQDYQTLLSRHVIAFLDARDPEVIAARFIGRNESRAREGRFVRPLSEKEIIERATESLELNRLLYERALRIGCKGVRIYVDDGLESNLKDVLSFEATLRESPVASAQRGD